ncbi:MAG: hypothetical protein E2598_12950 [Sphingobium sp.]|nr:hypothetical protein [Sphingobium sp.]
MKYLSRKSLSAALALAGAAIALPAQAQFYFSAPDLSGAPVTGAEPELGLNIPGATPEEQRAALVWHMRAALNVAALQCDFEPSLLTVSNYNAAIAHHDDELARNLATLTGYFHRTVGKGRPGDRAFDAYNTKVYLGYSTVHAQKDFCNVMGKIGRDAIFTPRGQFNQLASNRLSEVRKALKPTGEQYFNNPGYGYTTVLPDFDKKCWKKDVLTAKCMNDWNKRNSAKN